MHGSEALDLIHVAQRGGDHVKAFHEHGAVSRRDLEGPDAVARTDFLRDQVDRELDGRRVGERGHDRRGVLGADAAGEETVVEAVRVEDLAEARCDDGSDAHLHQAPDGVLAARAAAEVRTRADDRGLFEPGPVEDAVGSGRAVGIAAHVEKDAAGEPRLVDAAQELLGHDLVGVAVVDRKRCGDGRERGQLFHVDAPSQRRRQSVNLPVTAAAAAICGLTRCVRAPRP